MTGVALAVGRAKRDGPFSGERFGILTPFRYDGVSPVLMVIMVPAWADGLDSIEIVHRNSVRFTRFLR